MTVTEQIPQVSAASKLRGWNTILVHVEPGEIAGPRLHAAIALARQFDAHLIGVGAQCVDPMLLTFGPGSADTWAELQGQCQAELEQAAAEFSSAVGGLDSEFRSVEEKPALAMARAARSADVIVAGGTVPDGHDSFRTTTPAELAISSGRPVLVAPSSDRALAAKSVVVAWKESREARRAVSEALPLLRSADRVIVVEVCSADERNDAEFRTGDVAAALRRHGAPAEAKTVCAPDSQVTPVLTAEAKAVGADLIVAGCYGHTRVGEWVFGGVSRDLLRVPDRYLLISH